MAYCTMAQVLPFVKTRLSDNTAPTYDQAAAFITDVDGVLNMTMDQAGMDTPPTDANVLLWLKQASIAGTLAMIETVIYTQTGANQSDRGRSWQKKFDDAIAQIRRSPSSIGGPERVDYVMPDAADNLVEDEDTVMF